MTKARRIVVDESEFMEALKPHWPVNRRLLIARGRVTGVVDRQFRAFIDTGLDEYDRLRRVVSHQSGVSQPAATSE